MGGCARGWVCACVGVACHWQWSSLNCLSYRQPRFDRTVMLRLVLTKRAFRFNAQVKVNGRGCNFPVTLFFKVFAVVVVSGGKLLVNDLPDPPFHGVAHPSSGAGVGHPVEKEIGPRSLIAA